MFSLDKPSNYYCSRFARTIKHLGFCLGKKALLFYQLINSYFSIKESIFYTIGAPKNIYTFDQYYWERGA